jgi:hypothetical protein
MAQQVAQPDTLTSGRRDTKARTRDTLDRRPVLSTRRHHTTTRRPDSAPDLRDTLR